MSHRIVALLAWVALVELTLPSVGQKADAQPEKKAPDKPADEGKPASTNVGNSGYPRVHADSRVTFRL